MDAREFWKRLEFRICSEMWGLRGEDRHLRGMWCDGLTPDEYDLTGEEPQIRGVAYFGYTGQEIWHFMLIVKKGIESSDHIDWAALLPDEGLTGWLTPDPETKTLRVDPLSGYGDRS